MGQINNGFIFLLFRCDPAEHLKESTLGILFLLFLGQGVSGVPYSSIGRSKHAEYESVCHFDVLLKLFEFWPKNKLLNYLINLSINSQKPYLLLHFSTDFNKQGLK